MKRGDPFLPSVFPDENPIADYTVQKNTRKKPSDCKCKGLGYNLSPSALLPEEMKQQWGVGMFGKPTWSRPNLVSSTACCIVKENEPKCLPPTLVKNGEGCSSSKCCILVCKHCLRDPCLCSELYAKHDGFRIPESNTTRKQKVIPKGAFPKSKEKHSINSLLLGSSNGVSVVKRVTFYNSKENNNIISTSNFHRNGTSSVSLNGHTSSTSEVTNQKCGLVSVQSNVSASRRCLNGTLTSATNKLSYSKHEDIVVATPRVLHRQQPPLQHRRPLSSVASPPILGTTALRVPHGLAEPKSSVPRHSSQVLMLGSSVCSCDSCRQRASLMSKMEALGFPTSHSQQALPPYTMEACQRYSPATLRSALSTSSRYAPYTLPTYAYPNAASSVYYSPERYQCSSPSTYDYDSPPGLKNPPMMTNSMPAVPEMSKVDMSYVDSETSLASPMFSGYGEDITDLSVKDTVDFFVSMKSPFMKFTQTSLVDASSSVSLSPSSSEQCPSPNYENGPSSWYCSNGSCASTYTMSPAAPEGNYREPGFLKFDVADGPPQPMSHQYTSLVSDLEDELRCAIENIPTS